MPMNPPPVPVRVPQQLAQSTLPPPPPPPRTPTPIPLASAQKAAQDAANRIAANRSIFTHTYSQQQPKYGFVIAFSKFTGYTGIGGVPTGAQAQTGTDINTFINNTNFQGMIVLPLPHGSTMIDKQDVEFDQYKFGAGYASIANEVGPSLARFFQGQQTFNQAISQSLSSLLGNAGQVAGALTLGGAETTGVGQAAISGAAAFGGMAVNQFQTILLNGPTYKRYSLVFNLAPRNQQESQNIRDIIIQLRRSAAPALGNLNLFWDFPDILQCVYVPQGDAVDTFMYRFKPAVLESVSAHYAPNGEVAAFYNSQAPESVQLTLSFLEIEYWIRSNFGG